MTRGNLVLGILFYLIMIGGCGYLAWEQFSLGNNLGGVVLGAFTYLLLMTMALLPTITKPQTPAPPKTDSAS